MRICLTIDIDWAPDFVIEWMVQRVERANVSATWFATHSSNVLSDLATDPSQEIGLHPNFFPDSNQGQSIEEISNHLLSLFPNARGVRAHKLLDSSHHQFYYKELGIKYISNLLIWNKQSEPFYIPWADLWHFPISWEDCAACCCENSSTIPSPPMLTDNSVWVLSFHPLYCYLNEKPGMFAYAKCKIICKKQRLKLNELSTEFLEPLRQSGEGLLNMLDTILDMTTNNEFITLSSLYDELVKKGTHAI